MQMSMLQCWYTKSGSNGKHRRKALGRLYGPQGRWHCPFWQELSRATSQGKHED